MKVQIPFVNIRVVFNGHIPLLLLLGAHTLFIFLVLLLGAPTIVLPLFVVFGLSLPLRIFPTR